ncbi:DUF3450 domain-containing protein [Gallaecimonas pentaromativorans]|uniref:Uncharacterized protein DUF3450 n=1 Tax=Gallaecimonas pentaromativorans TaxID=584787 RepID=A0A3N1PQ89_9GAMM|nr:DUF3450 domain-containing protein [Gallaecimonas pentaromativorans]ROQ30158.1 uncharacterized protein DUF3450 [Gallaecimonas pentaromativorans]
MSRLSKRSTLAAALAGAFMFAGSAAYAADPLVSSQDVEKNINDAAAASQAKIDKLSDQTRDLVADYRTTVAETDNLKIYNDHIAKLIDSQKQEMARYNKQITNITKTQQGVVPLMYKMIDALDQFVKLDVPFEKEERTQRVQHLRDMMEDSSVSTSEKYRQILDAYQIEVENGSKSYAWQGILPVDGKQLSVDFVHVGRVAYLALSLDQQNAWFWNREKKDWEKLGDEYVTSVREAVKLARNQAAPNLMKLPIEAPESAE